MATVPRRVTRRTERPKDPAIAAQWEKVRQFLVLRALKSDISSRQNTLRDDLAEFVDQVGEEDEKGSKIWDLPQPITVEDTTYGSVKRERRVSVSLDEGATRELLHTKGPEVAARVIKKVVIEEIDQDELYVLNQEGILTDEELDSLFVETVTFAFKPIKI